MLKNNEILDKELIVEGAEYTLDELLILLVDGGFGELDPLRKSFCRAINELITHYGYEYG